jgi:hypothetical protein
MHLLASLRPDLLHPLAWLLLGFAMSMGIVALVSPRLFSGLATKGSRWVDTARLLALLDKRYDIDRHVLPHSRLLGALVVASACVLGWLLLKR